jgi:hypothetical protein
MSRPATRISMLSPRFSERRGDDHVPAKLARSVRFCHLVGEININIPYTAANAPKTNIPATASQVLIYSLTSLFHHSPGRFAVPARCLTTGPDHMLPGCG